MLSQDFRNLLLRSFYDFIPHSSLAIGKKKNRAIKHVKVQATQIQVIEVGNELGKILSWPVHIILDAPL